MKSFDNDNGMSSGSHDPIRWLELPAEAVGTAAKLLAPPPIKALPGDVAMRVRANVLNAKAAAMTNGESGSGLARNAGALKLGGIAVGAALFGAGAMTVVSSVGDPDTLRVVVAQPTRSADADRAQSNGASANKYAYRGDVAAGVAGNVKNTNPSERGTSVRHADGEANARTVGDGPGEGLRASARADDREREMRSARTIGSGVAHNAGSSEAKSVFPDEVFPDEVFPDEVSPAGVSPGVRSGADRDPSSVALVERQNIALHASNPVADVKAGHETELELLSSSEALDRPVVRPQFRRVTAARRVIPRSTLTSLEEETLLLEDARGKLGRNPDRSLALALEHQVRFKQGQLFEQRRMIHLEALLRLGRDDEAKKLAASIGSSIYQARAKALLVRYGIVLE